MLWVLSMALILLGLAGTVLPARPGTLFVLAGIVLGAWIDNFTRVGCQPAGAHRRDTGPPWSASSCPWSVRQWASTWPGATTNTP